MKQREQAELFLRKAAEDQTLVETVLGEERVSDEIIGFHCQQTVEKLLKALLSLHAVRFRKTHNLRELMDLLEDFGTPVPEDLQEVDMLNPYASVFRYQSAPISSPLDRTRALEIIRRLRGWVESLIRSA